MDELLLIAAMEKITVKPILTIPCFELDTIRNLTHCINPTIVRMLNVFRITGFVQVIIRHYEDKKDATLSAVKERIGALMSAENVTITTKDAGPENTVLTLVMRKA